MLTKREYYDLLIQSAHDGTFPSSDGKTGLYRGPNGTKCAVGLLITDEEFALDPECNNCGVRVLLNNHGIDVTKRVAGLTLMDLREIQRSHDGLADKSAWDGDLFVEKVKALECFKGVEEEEA